MGNHDVCAAGLREPIDFNPIARDAILWTRAARLMPLPDALVRAALARADLDPGRPAP